MSHTISSIKVKETTARDVFSAFRDTHLKSIAETRHERSRWHWTLNTAFLHDKKSIRFDWFIRCRTRWWCSREGESQKWSWNALNFRCCTLLKCFAMSIVAFLLLLCHLWEHVRKASSRLRNSLVKLHETRQKKRHLEILRDVFVRGSCRWTNSNRRSNS